MVVIGASSGGVEALRELVAGLPPDLPAALFVVLHFPEGTSSALARILDRSGPLAAVNPEDGEAFEPGRIYVARPGFHLLIEAGRVRLARGPKENRHRPAVDPLFRTAALACGPRVVGVVLSGARDDGTAGMAAIKRRGGVVVVQDPEDALFPGMPESVLRYVDVDYRLPPGGIARLLDRLSREPVKEGGRDVPDDMVYESRIAGLDPDAAVREEPTGQLSGFTCPDCRGPLYEIRDGELLRYRCRVGHAYTAGDVIEEKADTLEEALYLALNTLEESAAVFERLAATAGERGHAAARFERRAREARERAGRIRQAIIETPVPPVDDG